MINMSSAFVVGLLALSLAARPSDDQVDQISEVAIEHCRPVDRISTTVVTDFQVDRTPDVKIVDDWICQIPAVSDTDYQVDKIPATEIADGLPDPWIPDLFYRALSDFSVKNVGSTACRTQSDMYDRHLRNYTSWAVRMSESWNRYPIGLLAGNTYQMGIYDECVDVRHPVIGQYCLSDIKLIPLAGKDYSFNRTEDLDDFGNINAWKTVLGWGDYMDKVQRNRLLLGICIPNSCSALDLQTALQNELDRVFMPEMLKAIVKVDPIMCTVSGDMYPYDTSFYLTSITFLVLVLICCGTTLYHFIRISYNKNPKETTCDYKSVGLFCETFSIIDSSKALLKFDKDNELNSLYGFKVLMMMAILLGHRLFYSFGNHISNPKFVESIIFNGPDSLLTIGNLVDPFFFVSGFLMYLNISRSFQKVEAGYKKITSLIINRMLRMLPAYCAMMAITAHIVPHLGDGPLWPKVIWEEAEICKNYWWTNLFFISNFIDVKYGCLVINYYVSCDVQFFVVGGIIIYVYTKNTKYGIRLLATILSLSAFLPFLVTILTKRFGIDIFYLPYLENIRIYISLNKSYRLSYMRAMPFLGGLTTSIIVEKLKEKKTKFSRITVYGGTLIVSVICIRAQLYGAKFYTWQRPYYPLEHALYKVVNNCVWTVWCMWCSICLFTSGYGLFSYVLNNKLVVVLGRLSFSVFIVNITVLMMSNSSLRLPSYHSINSLIDTWISDTFKCYLLALALYLVVEAPFDKIIKRWIRRSTLGLIEYILNG
ncbi:nose resistant to fluoxetine protein 6-like isoform X3 [Rhopalosiphum maidis]|nr:nose resistant to fluoxetine protein 6-like isoform X3 [Rhopalosiphum maidis]XP_026815119.1 nose resistant to fluoxetine protein 6-like isoform X3 [Rhopalosiphum maidis]XP_026815120.1 nose resistant to fluoxetine protein 6-like isoform X3 [Rhopalosiphum maidis]